MWQDRTASLGPSELALTRPSVQQAQHSSPLYSIKSVHDVISVENCQQMLHGARGVALSRFDIFAEDASRVFNGAQKRLLVGGTHNANVTPRHGCSST
jgi:hypothetical protein